MRIVEKFLRRLPKPALDTLITWRNAYPNTPLKYLPLPFRSEVERILSSAIAASGDKPAPKPQGVLSPNITTCLPTGRTNGHISAQPANGTPRPAPARTIAHLTTVIGTDVKTGRDIAITQQAKQQGVYLLGANGTGKTNTVKTMAISDVQSGLGLCVIEPHGDLTAEILGAIPRHRQNDVVYLDVEDWQAPFGLNIYEVPEPRNIRTEAAVASFVSHTFEVLWSAGFETPRLMQNLRAVARVLIANPGAHFGDIPLLYSSEEVRARMLANVSNPQILTFFEEYEHMNFRDRRLFTESTLNKVTAFLDEPMIQHILAQPKTTINFRYIMDNRKILLIKLSPQFEEASRLIGAVIIGKILMTAFSRADTPENERRQFNLYCDEFHRFASSDFATLIAEARKFNIATCLSHQVLAQLSEANRTSALAAGNFIVFRVSGDDSRVLSRSFDTTPTQTIIGEEPIRAPVADVIFHLVRRGHNDPRVAKFAQVYLQALEKYSSTKMQERHAASYECFYGTLILVDLEVQRARKLLNDCLYRSMSEQSADIPIPPLALYVLATAQGNHIEHVFSPYIISRSIDLFGPHELRAFRDGMAAFGTPAFLTDSAARFMSIQSKKYRWMAERIVTMLTELRYCLGALAKAPILVDTGQYQPKYQNRTYQDMENQIARDLTNAPNYTAKVKLVTGGEYTLKTKPAPQGLTGDALAERIEAVKRHCLILGYTRHYTEVMEDIRKRQEHLLGLGDTPDEEADDDGYDTDEPPPPGSFSLD